MGCPPLFCIRRDEKIISPQSEDIGYSIDVIYLRDKYINWIFAPNLLRKRYKIFILNQYIVAYTRIR